VKCQNLECARPIKGRLNRQKIH